MGLGLGELTVYAAVCLAFVLEPDGDGADVTARGR